MLIICARKNGLFDLVETESGEIIRQLNDEEMDEELGRQRRELQEKIDALGGGAWG